MTLLLLYVTVALGFSFLCSVLEAVLLSVTPSFLAHLEQEQPKVGARMRALKENIDRPLAAILSLNTMAHTLGAAGAGAEAQRLWGSQILAIASAVLTVLILVFSEIIPKTVGAVFWRKLAPATARVLPPLIILMLPLVWLSELITVVIKRSDDAKDTVSREEIAALARLGEQQGVFAESESRILKSLFRFGSLRTRDIMTPRTVLYGLRGDSTVDAAVDGKDKLVFSRIPVYREAQDDILGYVLKDELLLRAAHDEGHRPVAEFAREMLVVPDTLPVPELFERLLDGREHIALVVDEYGGVDGVVTMEDVLETILGLEIVDEADAVQDMREMARRKWRERAKKLASEPPPAEAPAIEPPVASVAKPDAADADS